MAYKLLIDGKLVDGVHSLDVVNPATGAVMATCSRADTQQLELAVDAAKRAFPAWAALSYAERRSKLEAIADALESRTDEFARLLTQEQGRPLQDSIFEVMGGVMGLRAYAALEVKGRTIRESDTERLVELRDPLGVVAAILPWNYPLLLMLLKVGPALIAGNTVVAKPAPTTPLASLLFAEMVATILPPGVFNMIVDANDLGDQLSNHKDVAKVSFTGSTATGKKVMASSASTLKRLTLELGGNDAAIVLDDVDVKAAAPKIFQAAMLNSGQICIAVKRVYAHASVYDELCEEFVRLAGEVVLDDGLKQGTTMGPLQNQLQFQKVKGYLDDARANGTVIAGGYALDRDGYFIAPTIVRDISNDARVVREEQFGPVLPVMSYDDLDDAIALANATEYGLGGSVWTSDVERGFAVASRIQSGVVWVNKAQDVPFDVPFRPAKQSGLGEESGLEGVEGYTQARLINVAL